MRSAEHSFGSVFLVVQRLPEQHSALLLLDDSHVKTRGSDIHFDLHQLVGPFS